LLFLLLLLAPVYAQENPYLQFIGQVLARVQANDLDGAAALVRGNSETAAQTFEITFFAYPQMVDPAQKRTALIYTNLVARVFEDAGNPGFVNRLRAQGMLIETAGTPAPAGTPPPAAAGPASASAEAAGMELYRLYMWAIRTTLRSGNFLAANRQAQAYKHWIEDLAKRGYPVDLPFAQTLAAIVDMTAMDAVGIHTGTEEMAVEIVSALTKKPIQPAENAGNPVLFVRVALAAAGRDSARPALVDANVSEGLKIAGQEDDDAVGRFALLGFQAERELEKDPELPLEALLARHEAAWAPVRQKSFGNLHYGGLGRWFCEAARFWMNELARREALQVAGSPAAARLAALRQQDEQTLLELAGKALANSQLGSNPEFLIGLLDYQLDEGEALQLTGDFEASRQKLAALAAPLAMLQEFTTRLDRDYAERISREVARLQPVLAVPGVRLGVETLPASLEEGEALRLGARNELLWVRQELAETPGKLPADRFEKVRGHLGKAQQLQEKARGGVGARGLDQVGLSILAVLFHQRGEKWQEHAATMLTEQLNLARALNERPGLIAALTYEGELRAATGNPAAAIQSLSEAVRLAEDYIREAGATEKGAVRLRERYHRAYELLVQLLLEAGRNAEAFAVLGRMQQLDAIAWAAPQLGYRRDLSGLKRLRGEAAALEEEVVARKQARQEAGPAASLLAGKKAEYRQALEGIKKVNPELEQLLAVHPVSLEDVQRALPADTVVVEYFPAPDALYVFVANKKELKVRKVAVQADDLRTLVREARAGIIQGGRQAGGATPPALGSLHKFLIDPVEADLAALVVFIPTGFLDYVPFAALTDASGKFLIERKRCATILKSSEIEQITRARAKDGQVVALGNPDGSLPEAAAEVKQIGQLFPGASTKVGAAVSKADVQVAPGVGVLHLATHGVLDHKNPAGSYLVLGGNQNLMITDIYGLKLKGLRLVTLSACDTAVGEREPGRNLTTLADAFGVAGSPTVIASLWKVSDASTRELMVAFYKGLKEKKSLAEALQGAQRSLIARPELRHPFYWAPFVLLGDWR